MNAAAKAGTMRRSIQRPDGVALIQFILVVLALTSIGDGLAELIKGIGSNPTFLIALLGTFTGWQLARSRWKGWKSAGLIVLCGAAVLLLTVGGLAAPLWRLAAAFFSALFASGQQLLHRLLVFDTSSIAAAWGGLGGAWSGLLARCAHWFQHAGDRPAPSDPLVLGLLWGLAIWLLAGWAAWMVRRRSAALPALLPGLALLAWASFYTNSRQSLPALLLVGAELAALQLVQNYQSSRSRWQAAGLGRIEVETGQVASAVGLCVLLALAGALTPSISVKQMADSINKTFERHDDRLAESLGLQATPQGWTTQGDSSSAGSSLSTSHSVLGYSNPSTEVVMTVAVDGYKPPPPGVILPGETAESTIRYYWRSQTFDFYTGRGWTVTTNQTEALEANQPLHPDQGTLPDGFQMVTQHITRQLPGQAVLVTGELLELDQPASVTWRSPDDLAGAVTQANTYTAESRVPLVTVETLRKAGTDYPEQIRQFYLQIPDDLPARVRDLAFEITSKQTNPYDQATAIETFLRQYPYTQAVPAPPAGRDLADFFLFDLQQGYCDYYASTMVVLARAAGIPARLVLGYARGNYDEANGTFIVHGNNAHAWVEVYFPGSGWIEFEPTANQPSIARLHDSDVPIEANPLPAVPLPKGPPAVVRFWRGLNIPSGWYTAAGIALLLALLIPLEGWLLHLQKPERALAIIQQRLYRLGHRWDLPHAGTLTPFEFSEALAARLEPFARTPRLSAMLASIRWELDWQTGLYMRSLYAGRSPSGLETYKAVQAWLVLERRLWWLRLRFWRKK